MLKHPWIRSWQFDVFWILSGLPFGVLLMAIPSAYQVIAIFLIIMVMQTAHTISPMALAWTHDGFRPLMLRRPVKYIAFPLGLLVGTAAVGWFTRQQLKFDPNSFSIAVLPRDLLQIRSPLMMAALLYMVWNAYHFGKQAFGVLSIYRVKRGRYPASQRQIDKVYCCSVIWMALVNPFVLSIGLLLFKLTGWPPSPRPFLIAVHATFFFVSFALIGGMLVREWWVGWSLPRVLFILTDGLGLACTFMFGILAFAIISLNHWLVAIGIASHVHANHTNRSPWPFALAVIGVGFVLFCALFVDPSKVPAHGLSIAALTFTATTVGLRIGLGFDHFLFDRWLYKLSDPRIRETIGADIFSAPKHIEVISDGAIFRA